MPNRDVIQKSNNPPQTNNFFTLLVLQIWSYASWIGIAFGILSAIRLTTEAIKVDIKDTFVKLINTYGKLVDPVRELCSQLLRLNVSRFEFDVIVLYLVLASMSIRALLAARSAERVLNMRSQNNLVRIVRDFFLFLSLWPTISAMPLRNVIASLVDNRRITKAYQEALSRDAMYDDLWNSLDYDKVTVDRLQEVDEYNRDRDCGLSVRANFDVPPGVTSADFYANRRILEEFNLWSQYFSLALPINVNAAVQYVAVPLGVLVFLAMNY